MLDKKYFALLRNDIVAYAVKRRAVIKMASDAQHLSKKAIFAGQRDDQKEANRCLADAEKLLLEINKIYGADSRIADEGAYRASLEEFVEAALFHQFLRGEKFGKIKNFEKIDSELYISGLCDVPGELTRYAIKAATARDFAMAKKCYAAAEAVVGEMVDMDLTGYNRQKFDQAKQALHKLQQVVYEVSLC